MEGITKVTVGFKVMPEYVKEIDTMVEFFQNSIDVGKVTRSEVLLKALDGFKERVSAKPEYQTFLANQNK